MTRQTQEIISYIDQRLRQNNADLFEQIKNNNDQIYDYLDQKFRSVNKRIDNLSIYCDKRFDAIDEKFIEMDEHFNQVDARLWVLESDFKVITANLK